MTTSVHLTPNRSLSACTSTRRALRLQGPASAALTELSPQRHRLRARWFMVAGDRTSAALCKQEREIGNDNATKC